jgi:tetratricopeptide (TPR) repeat protein
MVSGISHSTNQPTPPQDDEDVWTLTLDIDVLWRGILLFAATLLSHWQAIGGGFIWDDDAHVTKQALRSLQGLWEIWFKLGATQQYYPLLHSIFWFEHAIWGDQAVYYHVANILFHATAACILVAVLRKLAIPGAWVAGFIFALHPVHVESVAWITEQKNTISAIFYLLSAFNYFKYDESRNRKDYAYAIGFFILALLSKTVTATLPAAFLVIIWWKRGRIDFKKDVFPLLPWFVLGAIGGLFTAWVERVYIGANGSDFMLTPLMRCLLAGHVIWFYLGKLLLPVNLIFIYEHWNVSSLDPVQYFYLLAVIAAVLGLLWIAVRPTNGRAPDSISRAPLAGFLFFCGTLFPVLGFANVYPFMFSYVADHFQYLASLGIIVPFAAGATMLLNNLSHDSKPTVSAIGGVGLALFGVLSWNQCSIYKDAETLYLNTIQKNPMCWMAHNNVGAIWLNQGRVADAQAQFEEAIRIRPPYADAQGNLSSVLLRTGHPQEAYAHALEALRLRESPENENNLGIALASLGHLPEAIQHYEMALRLRPNYVEVLNNAGNAYMQTGNKQEALNKYQAAIKYAPNYAEPYTNLASLLVGAGHPQEGIAAFEQVVRLQMNNPTSHINLANAYFNVGRHDEAIVQFQQALQLNPNNADAWYFLGNAYVNMGQFAKAEEPYLNTLKLNAGNVGAENNLAAVYYKLSRIPEAIGHYESAIRLNPNYAEAHNNLGVALAASKMNSDAIAEYKKATQLNPNYADAYNNIGLSYAGMGKFSEAEVQYRKALAINFNNPEYHDNLARTLNELGRKVESQSESKYANSLRTPQVGIPTANAQQPVGVKR